MLIQENYPELSKYLNEMPVTIPDESTPEINGMILKQYYESLTDLLRKYIMEDPLKNTSTKAKGLFN